MAGMQTSEYGGHAGQTRQERDRLSGEVLRLGELPGWQLLDMMLFTEALVQHPWRRCGIAEYSVEVEEQRSLLAAVAA